MCRIYRKIDPKTKAIAELFFRFNRSFAFEMHTSDNIHRLKRKRIFVFYYTTLSQHELQIPSYVFIRFLCFNHLRMFHFRHLTSHILFDTFRCRFLFFMILTRHFLTITLFLSIFHRSEFDRHLVVIGELFEAAPKTFLTKLRTFIRNSNCE